MPINPNIALGVKPIQFESPVNQLANVLQIQGAQQANELNGMKMQEYQRTAERQSKLQSLLGGLPPDANNDVRISALRNGGFLDEADKVETGIGNRRKIESDASAKDMETKSKKLDIIGQTFGAIRANPTLENAHAAFEFLGSNGIYSPEEVAQFKQRVADNPQSVGQLADIGFRAALSAKDQLVKTTSENAGGNFLYNSTDPVTGRVTQTGTAPITESANNIANNKRIAAEGAANRGVTMRGQNMTDARSRDANAVARDNKPLTEGQSKSALFGSRMATANQIFDALEQSGTTTSTPGMNSGYGIGSVVSALSSSDQQQLMQAKRDYINAVLRRESGAVIGESEFANAEKQYFPQIGDSKETIAQKRANREAAMRGVLIDVPEGRRADIVQQITGGASKPAANASGGFKYLGTD